MVQEFERVERRRKPAGGDAGRLTAASQTSATERHQQLHGPSVLDRSCYQSTSGAGTSRICYSYKHMAYVNVQIVRPQT